jgi:hypothetical protein
MTHDEYMAALSPERRAKVEALAKELMAEQGIEFVKLLQDAEVPITVNEFRTTVLGWEPLPPTDHRGNTVLRRGE